VARQGRARRGVVWFVRAGQGSAGHGTAGSHKKEGGNILVYEYKLPGMYPVPAQQAGEELDRIYDKHGTLEAADVVNESRPEDAVLHPCFEWRDPVAAELWRNHQARGIIGCIITVKETKSGGTVPTRAFFHVSDGYTPVDVVLKNPDKHAEAEQSALREMKAFQEKFRIITDLAPVLTPVFDAMETAARKMRPKGTERASAPV